jgi:hypothetical protein
MADPDVGSWTPINMFAMLRALINNYTPVLNLSGPPTSGTSGSFVGRAGPGAILIDYLNAVVYINQGTLASPLWNIFGGATAGLAGLGAVGNAKATYSFATDGGAIGTITPLNSPTIPLGAIILGGVLEVQTIAASGGAATIAVGLGSGAQVASLVAAAAFNGAPWSTTGMKAIIPVFTVATYVKAAAATRLTFTIAAATLTGGIFNVNVAYIQGS